MAQKVTIETLDDAINEILEEYSEDVVSGARAITKAIGPVAVQTLKSNVQKAGIGGRKYHSSFRAEHTEQGLVTTMTLHSKEYQLTHLLEHGHAVKDRNGQVHGTAKAFPHWAQAEETLSDLYEQKIVLKIKGGK